MSQVNQLFTCFVEGYIADQIKGVSRDDLPYILTHTGKRFCHLDPRPEDVCIEDIAHALSRICRYTGHVDAPHYSVAQHSVLVSYAVPLRKDALVGLLHDATEAYCTDVSRPLKRAPGMEAYRLYEAKTAAAIASHFKLGPIPESVHEADMRILTTEMRDLFSHPNVKNEVLAIWDTFPPYKQRVTAWDQVTAEKLFLARYVELTQPNTLRQFCWPD